MSLMHTNLARTHTLCTGQKSHGTQCTAGRKQAFLQPEGKTGGRAFGNKDNKGKKMFNLPVCSVFTRPAAPFFIPFLFVEESGQCSLLVSEWLNQTTKNSEPGPPRISSLS